MTTKDSSSLGHIFPEISMATVLWMVVYSAISSLGSFSAVLDPNPLVPIVYGAFLGTFVSGPLGIILAFIGGSILVVRPPTLTIPITLLTGGILLFVLTEALFFSDRNPRPKHYSTIDFTIERKFHSFINAIRLLAIIVLLDSLPSIVKSDISQLLLTFAVFCVVGCVVIVGYIKVNAWLKYGRNKNER